MAFAKVFTRGLGPVSGPQEHSANFPQKAADGDISATPWKFFPRGGHVAFAATSIYGLPFHCITETCARFSRREHVALAGDGSANKAIPSAVIKVHDCSRFSIAHTSSLHFDC